MIRAPYYAIATVCLLFSLLAGWIPIALQMDNNYYDWLMRLNPPPHPARDAVVLAVDDLTLQRHGGSRNLRRTIANALDAMSAAPPKAVVVDLILSDDSSPEDDAALAAAMRKTRTLILASDLVSNAEQWENPLPAFRAAAKAVGHVHVLPDRFDGVARQVPLERLAALDRRWALSLEAFRLATGAEGFIESNRELTIGKTRIPIPGRLDQNMMYIRYRNVAIPSVPMNEILEDHGKAAVLKDKVVFLGVTSQSMARDRLLTPYSFSVPLPGVAIHAHIYETIAQGEFLVPASHSAIALACLILALASATGFTFLAGWQAYVVAVVQIVLAHSLPHTMFSSGVVFPLMAPAASAWMTGLTCAAYLHFVVRRQLARTQQDKARYQQAIHFVSHEMRSPLSAIQGSSEMMGRYNLSEDKRKQMAAMIHSESKRLGKMIQTFLDVERLGEGQMELKREPFLLEDVITVCAGRARPLAEGKHINIYIGDLAAVEISGDRELMEYAVYNLLTNAIKYSPERTQVNIDLRVNGGNARVSVQDQGIGMDEKELKRIGTRFYRTERAEKSGEVGTGIGLSIVSQIVHHHGGKLEVTSAVGKGSCFTINVPAK
ncbi:MAG: CHASE2 domain-containing protein [Candidatus Solibacter usitatus]|nr:CHASE2 domain-containing protein [Candidatus Solibacter usitatus]